MSGHKPWNEIKHKREATAPQSPEVKARDTPLGAARLLDAAVYHRWADAMGGEEGEALRRLITAMACDHPEHEMEWIEIEGRNWTCCHVCGMAQLPTLAEDGIEDWRLL